MESESTPFSFRHAVITATIVSTLTAVSCVLLQKLLVGEINTVLTAVIVSVITATVTSGQMHAQPIADEPAG